MDILLLASLGLCFLSQMKSNQGNDDAIFRGHKRDIDPVCRTL